MPGAAASWNSERNWCRRLTARWVALLGASPGASTAVWIAIEVLERCFASELKGWTAKLKQMIPSYGESLIDDAALCRRVRAEIAKVLRLQNI
jgi:malate dehydrogenase (quinone)